MTNFIMYHANVLREVWHLCLLTCHSNYTCFLVIIVRASETQLHTISRNERPVTEHDQCGLTSRLPPTTSVSEMAGNWVCGP